MNKEALKKEQSELKDRLVKVVGFINSEEYFALDFMEKSLLNQQRAGMELYLNALTNRIWGNSCDISAGNSMMLPLLMGMFNSWGGSSYGSDYLKNAVEKEDKSEKGN